MTPDEQRHDVEQTMWHACLPFISGYHEQALNDHRELIDKGSDDQMLHVYIGCCLERLGWHQEAEEARAQGPRVPAPEPPALPPRPTGSTTRTS